MMDLNRIIYLLSQDRKGELNLQEKAELNQWLVEPKNRRLYHKLRDKQDEDAALTLLQSYNVESELKKVHRTIAKPNATVRMKSNYWRFSAIAASLLIFVAAAYYIYVSQTPKNKEQIVPGSDMATLILENGTKIALDTIGDVLSNLHHIRISTDANQRPVYEFLGNETAMSGSHIIQTPRGGEYRVLLPDGSKVWLNAESSLEYPMDFLTNRAVKLTGEAYFDVNTMETQKGFAPFTVELPDHKLEVLGTQFNVNSYSERPFTETTLVEGRVNILSKQKQTELRPGEQAIVKRGETEILVHKVDTREFSDWKDGHFYFDDAPIQHIMNKVSKWYDVDVEYVGDITNEGFGGEVSRFDNLEELLSLLEMTEKVHFKIEGRRVIVMP